MRGVFARVGAWCVERPGPVIALAVLLVILGAVGALTLKPNGEADTLVDESSDTYQATEELKDKFGDDPIVVLIKGDLEQMVLTEDLQRILFLESCLAGTAPEGEVAKGIETPEVCNELAASKPARVVYGPATFLNQFANQATQQLQAQQAASEKQARVVAKQAYQSAIKDGLSQEQAAAAAEAAARQVQQAFTQQAVQIGLDYGLQGPPSIQDPTFVRAVVFDNRFTEATPKSKFSAFFPSSESVAVSVRLRPDLTDEERSDAIDLIRQVTAEDVFQIRGASYLVSGPPVLADGLTDELSGQITILLIAALIVMALVLALVFAPPLRLLPLAVGLAASAIAFGALALFGGSLTMAVIAGLPILIGLAVDYAIQIQARFTEARRAGSSPARAAGEAAATGGPVVATAGLATAAGFLVLILSPIPMVQSFGLLLVGGLAIAFGLVITAGLAILSMTGSTEGEGRFASVTGRFRPTSGRFHAPEWVTRVRAGLSKLGPKSLAASIAIPGKVIAAAAVLAVAGWIAGTQTKIISDFHELLPASLPELKDVGALEEETGVSGYVDVAVDTDDISDPEVVAWMKGYRDRVLEAGGYTDNCRDPEARVCPAISLPDLFGDEPPTQERIQGVLSLLPPYFAQAVVETDPETGEIGNTALLSFGIKVMPFDDQKELVDEMRALVDTPGAEPPPEGTEISVTPPSGSEVNVLGLAVLAADANASLGSNRYLLTLAGLGAVALVLFGVGFLPAARRLRKSGDGGYGAAAGKAVRRALVPLIPVVLAPGWSALVLEGAQLDLNPMSATLGALVIAIATEFSVLLSARYYEERERGESVGEALRLTYSRTGAAVIASGLTAIAGFAVLALAAPVQAIFGTDAIRMLTEFGLVGVIDLAIALAGVLLVLPAVLVWAEGDFASARAAIGRVRRRRPATTSA
ncbi:MAG TPA: MMPL family transporter [Solirubrobacterales bacterium]|nr:MMPL family transporter [Solirubrobacterales bacterium]